MPKPQAETIKSARKQLGLTQKALSQILGVSEKAIQSYEQGWREVPGRVTMQVLVLLSVHRRDAEVAPPCWEVRGCSPEQRAGCPSYTIGHGRFCWFVTARVCQMDSEDLGPGPLPCLQCPVVNKLLQGDRNAEGLQGRSGVEYLI